MMLVSDVKYSRHVIPRIGSESTGDAICCSSRITAEGESSSSHGPIKSAAACQGVQVSTRLTGHFGQGLYCAAARNMNLLISANTRVPKYHVRRINCYVSFK